MSTRYYSLRVWTKSNPEVFCFELVEFLEKQKLMHVDNFDNYGEDGSSNRLDLRQKGSPIKIALIRRALAKSKEWKHQVLHVGTEEWIEPGRVKLGHDYGTVLARRFHDSGSRFAKQGMSPRTLGVLITLLVNRLWGMEIDYPAWEHKKDEQELKKQVEQMVKTTDGQIPRDWWIFERTLHNFLNNIGWSGGPRETLIWDMLFHYWTLSQMFPKPQPNQGAYMSSLPSSYAAYLS